MEWILVVAIALSVSAQPQSWPLQFEKYPELPSLLDPEEDDEGVDPEEVRAAIFIHRNFH